jgi:hypothetical protein
MKLIEGNVIQIESAYKIKKISYNDGEMYRGQADA